MKTNKEFIEYINRFHEGNKNEIYFIENKLGNRSFTLGDKNKELSESDIEHILDFLYSTKKAYKNIGLKTIYEKAEKWNKELQKLSNKDDEVEGEDYEVVKDFGDGFKFVKLISQSSYNREGKLMSHCVASYYGRDIAIYSLRDKNNNPHCTIEENNQVKGKLNQTVDNKYFGYCIKFLEEMGFSMGENEMKNIGYYKLDTIDKDLTCAKLWDGQYVSDKDLDLIKDKDGNQYEGFGLLNIKSLFEFNIDMSIKWNFDIEKIKAYLRKSIKQDIKDNSKLSGGDRSQLAGGNYSQLAGGYSSQLVGGYDSKLSGGDYSQLAGGNYSKLSGGNSSKIAGGNSSQLILNGKNSIAVGGHGSIGKGKKGSYIVLCENNKDGNIQDVKVLKIDGETIKEDTFYKLENGEFIEVTK